MPARGRRSGVAAWLLVLLAAAELVRLRGQREAELERSRDEQLARRASEERMRIARDLHDVVAHNISVINVQANTALHLMDRQPDRAREALTAIHEVSKQALAELRSVLGVLRADGSAAQRTPSPGLAQLDDLLSAVRSAGLEIRLSVRRRRAAVARRRGPGGLSHRPGSADEHGPPQREPPRRGRDPLPAGRRPHSGGRRRAAAGARIGGQARAGNGITGMNERAHALAGACRRAAGRTAASGSRPGCPARIRCAAQPRRCQIIGPGCQR